jgi:hypothetical protein
MRIIEIIYTPEPEKYDPAKNAEHLQNALRLDRFQPSLERSAQNQPEGPNFRPRDFWPDSRP